MINFFRYPHTPYLVWLGVTSPRGDKVLSHVEVKELLARDVIVEEKLDGANLGISLKDEGELMFQNRGQYLTTPFRGQFARLNGWAAQHRQALLATLTPGLILFGEWLAARHSVPYNRLPDWFVAFDVYDLTEGAFWSATRRDSLINGIGLSVVPCLLHDRVDLPALKSLVSGRNSMFGNAELEGLVIRRDGIRFNERRAKLVRPGFTQAIDDHWRHRGLEWNQIDPR